MTIHFNGEKVAVTEVARMDWDFVLYESAESKGQYYLSLLQGSIGIYEEIVRVHPNDAELIGGLTAPDLVEMVKDYRQALK